MNIESLPSRFDHKRNSPEFTEKLQSPEAEVKAVTLFKEVQAYQFSISRKTHGLNIKEECENTRRIKAGTCTTKHNLLAVEFTKLGFETLLVTYPFYWRDLPVEYPREIRSLVSDMPLQYHLALGVYVNESLSIIDATWDPILERAGFPISNLDNKIQPTVLGIVPSGQPIFHFSPEERQQYIERIKKQMPNDPVVHEFYVRLDDWLQEIRNTSSIH